MMQTLVTFIFCAVVTGVGGGTIRDLLIGAPVALAALVAGMMGFTLRGAAIARGLSLPAYGR